VVLGSDLGATGVTIDGSGRTLCARCDVGRALIALTLSFENYAGR
jgi:hypothetical protein